ncbi:ABC transporter permease [Kaistia sp. 32K]|uniref:ABC transporter permease n=1 Tax=Kaistia sp. 32K TaxID=2795690 RepID=UPI001916A3BF|nr:ABC transporter permease [Kaistia sp. 32K]BCP53993.1 ABC transporter permease [Kaistia sp. 32K]
MTDAAVDTADVVPQAQGATHQSQAVLAWRTFTRDRIATISLVMIAIVSLVAILAPWIAPYDPYSAGDQVRRLLPPFSEGHLLGTDGQGRDILSRLIWGGRVSLPIGILPPLATAIVALTLGITAGFFGGRVAAIIMRPLDVLFAFPMVLLAVAVSAVLGPGVVNIMLSMSIVMIPYFTRVVYIEAASIRNRDYIDAARVAGSSTGQILFQEVLPNVLAPVLTYATTAIGSMIVFASGLSFLGLGVQPPISDWGIMSSDGLKVLGGSPHVATIPGIIIVIVALSFNFVGDGIRDAMDPRQRTIMKR